MENKVREGAIMSTLEILFMFFTSSGVTEKSCKEFREGTYLF